MYALSIRQPWAWAIVYAGKRIENRTWRTKMCGEILIHASKAMTLAEYEDAVMWMQDFGLVAPRVANFGSGLPSGFVEPQVRVADFGTPSLPRVPRVHQLRRGGIVGRATIVDCVDESESNWFTGPHGFVLENVRETPFVPCSGALGFWRVPEDIVEGIA